MKLKNDILRLSSITVLLAVTISLAAPSAFAMPGLGTGTTPATPVQGQIVTLDLTGSGGAAPHNLVSIRVFEAGLNPTAPADHGLPAALPTCLSDGTMPDSDGVLRAWDLMHGGVVAQFNVLAPLDVLTITYGTGAGAETVMYDPAGAPPAAPIAGPMIADAGIGAYHWEQTSVSPSPGTRDDNTNILTASPDFYTFINCGTETGANPAFFDDHDFATQEPIGGEILAINTAALLIAGLSTSAIWMIPAAGAVAGTAVTLYKLRQK